MMVYVNHCTEHGLATYFVLKRRLQKVTLICLDIKLTNASCVFVQYFST